MSRWNGSNCRAMKTINKKTIIVLCALFGALCFSLPARASETAKSLFVRGNYLYEQEEYAEASKRYEDIIARGSLSADVFYNLGNSYFKQGKLGKSIVNYERASLLKPRDKDTAKNLEVAQNKVVDKVKLPDTIVLQKSIIDIHDAFTLDETLHFLSILIVILTVLIALTFYAIHTRRILIPIIAVFAALLMCVAASCGIKIYENQNVQKAVVIAQKITVHSGPGKQYSVQFAVHEGTTFRAVKSLHGWLEVYISGDLRGWVQQEEVEIVWPVT